MTQRGAVLLVALVACTRQRPVEMPAVYASVEGAEERAQVTAWIAEVRTLLASKELAANLAALAAEYPVVFLRDRALGDIAELVDVLHIDEEGLRYSRTPVFLRGDTSDFIARAGWTGDFPNGGGVQTTSMTLGRGHLQRYTSSNVVERSCAINTLAHETTHTIVTHPSKVFYAIMDTGTAPPSDARAVVASYLVGSVAQCTWLQNRDRLPRDRAHLAMCVELFGARSFNSLRCDRFANGQPIEPRSDLPGPAAPSWSR